MNDNVLSIMDVKDELYDIIDLGISLKRDHYQGKSLTHYLQGKRLALIFERKSVRTRVSFEFGIQLLGGHAVFLTQDELGINTRESVEDIALVLSRYSDIIMYRALERNDLIEMAEKATVPVINGLDLKEHPCQILADLMTIKEKKGSLEGLKFCFVGDGNDNLTHTYMVACTLCGMDVTIVSPKPFFPNEEYTKLAQKLAEEKGTTLTITDDLNEVRNADVFCSDTWTSLWFRDKHGDRKNLFDGFTITQEMMAKGKEDAIFMHCMPIYYGEEVAYEVAHGPQSVIIDEAENRMWAEMALMVKLLKK